MSELVPQARMLGVLHNPTNPGAILASGIPKDMREAADRGGIQLQQLPAGTESDIETAFDTLVGMGGGALLVAADPFFGLRCGQIVTLAIRHQIPTIFDNRIFVEAGGLISYGGSTVGRWRPAGVYVGKILAGANPADLPVQQSTKFELVINKTTAKAIGLTIPAALLARADEVIE